MNGLRKDHEQYAYICVKLLKKWRDLIKPSAVSTDVSPAGKRNTSGAQAPVERKTTKQKTMGSSHTDRMPVDPVRSKSVEMLTKALMTKDADDQDDFPASEDLCTTIAISIEDAIFVEHRRPVPPSTEYKAKLRSRYMALLRESSGRNLREQLIDGSLDPTSFVKMTPEQLASEQQRKMNEELNRKNLEDNRVFNGEGAAETDQFRCGKCGKRRCTYYQMQTRSADEPMTTFITCLNCSNKWKM